MRSDRIVIDGTGNGFRDAVAETRKVVSYLELTEAEALQLELITEEMLSLARSVTGEIQAAFYLENEGRNIELHMTTKTVMDREKRAQLLTAATSRKNEAAKTFLGRLRDAFELALTADAERVYYELPAEMQNDVVHSDDEEWDGYERSILRRLADNVKISIRGGLVDMTVLKRFDK